MVAAIILITTATKNLVESFKTLVDIYRTGDKDSINKALTVLGVIVAVIFIMSLITAYILGNSNAFSSNRLNLRGSFAFLNGFRPTFNIVNRFGGLGRTLMHIGIAVLAIIAGLWLLLDAFSKLIDISNRWDSENGKNKIVQVVTDFCMAFIESAPFIEQAAEKFEEMLINFLLRLMEDILIILKGLLDFLVAGITYLAKSIADALIGLLNGLAGFDLATWTEAIDTGAPLEAILEDFIEKSENAPINRLINAVIAILVLVIYGIGDAIDKNIGPLAVAAVKVIKALVKLILAIIGVVITLIGGMFDEDFTAEMLGGFVNNLFKNIADNWWDGVVTYILPALQRSYDAVAGALWTFIFGIGDFIASAWESVQHTWADGVNEIFGEGTVGYSHASTYLDDQLAYFKALMTGRMDEYVEQIYKPANQGSSRSGHSGGGHRIGEVTDEINETKDANSYVGALENVGHTRKELQEKAAQLRAEETESIVEETENMAADAGTSGAESFVDKMVGYLSSKSTKEKVSGAFASLFGTDFSGLTNSGEGDYSTDIQEVFNLDSIMNKFDESSIGQSITDISSQFGEMSTSLADTNQYTQEATDALAAENGSFYDDTDMLNKMDEMIESNDNLADIMSKMDIRLDSGALVGEMAPQFDSWLARSSVRSSRGN